MIKLQLKSVPKLAQVSFGRGYTYNMNRVCSDLSSYLSQIEMLSLDTYDIRYEKEFIEGSVFTRLMKLDVKARPNFYDDLCCCVSLIKACPFLHHFKLSLHMILFGKRLKLNKWESCPHYHLKVVEIVGFVGHAIDMEFAAYLMDNAISLDIMIADTRDAHKVGKLGGSRVSKDAPNRKRAMERAKRLHANRRTCTQLQII